MKNLPFETVLALSPHTDDIEFGCGGTLARLYEQGAKIHTAIFSHCEKSVPEGYHKKILIEEMKNAAEKLGIIEQNINLFDYPVREFKNYRQQILDNFITLRNEIEPDLVLAPSSEDVHQDHEVIHKESLRAFRFNTLLGYELPWNNFSFPNSVMVELKEKHLDTKTEAIDCYKSQKFRSYGHPDFFKDGAKIRGMQNKRELVERFEGIKIYF